MSEMRTIINVKEILRDTNNKVKICEECQSMRALDYAVVNGYDFANQSNSFFHFFVFFFVFQFLGILAEPWWNKTVGSTSYNWFCCDKFRIATFS